MHFPSLSRVSIGLSVVLAAALFAGCGVSDPKSPKFVVAKGHGVKVTRGEVDHAEAQFFAQRGVTATQVPKEQLAALDREVAQQMVTQSLLLQEATKLKLPSMDAQVNAEIQKIQARVGGAQGLKDRLKQEGVTEEKLKEDLTQQFRIREVIRLKTPVVADPPPQAIEKFYNEKKAMFSRPATTRASHVLVQIPHGATPAVKTQKKALIDAARARVAKGEDFARVAGEVSEDPGSAKKGGDLGYFAQGQMVPAFEKVALASQIGAVSPVFETPYGYHFLKVTERRPAGTVSLEEARPQITAYLKNLQAAENLKAYFKKLEADAGVVYHLEAPAPEKAGAAIPKAP